MTLTKRNIFHKILPLLLAIIGMGWVAKASATSNGDFVVVVDAGHGGKDHGAIDNNAREKDINLAVAQRVAELIRKKLKDTKVVMTRDDDTFVSLQGRADIANKAKGDLFISIHTNSVDAKNKNRSSVAGASVYTLGANKDDANMAIARRENSVIEMEDGHEQKYSGFDPNKDESYIIFEMAQKKNLAQSNRFAKMVQDNLVKIAGRKDRGVKQAGFWVLWSTSMPAVLVELDFICNPQSASFMTSKDGVEKMADAIFQAVKVYVQNYQQSVRVAQDKARKEGKATLASDKKDKKKRQSDKGEGENVDDAEYLGLIADVASESDSDAVGISYRPDEEDRDKSHARLAAASNQRKPRTTSDGRRRRSRSSREASSSRNVEGEIALRSEFTGEQMVAASRSGAQSASADPEEETPAKGKKSKKKSSKKISTKKYATPKAESGSGSAKEKKDKNAGKDGEKSKKELKAEQKAREKAMKEAQRRAREEQKEKGKKKEDSKKTPAKPDSKKGGTDKGEIKEEFRAKTADPKPDAAVSEKDSGQKHAGKRKSLKRKIAD